ncbi:glycerophosphodiester phosphodiesterase family protein [uncultured Paraglaciecola sp.]|uniref:glycerophosphodiester phosphodiesterase family protein n=1 Tax=uncultured Paraglaciecola sp. TaxID=1765024 RepID=UPI0030DACDE9|tara:strand:+ start:8111 stop:9097 length:987 start_codon:yes stop_codon:yes gene_type:complete
MKKTTFVLTIFLTLISNAQPTDNSPDSTSHIQLLRQKITTYDDPYVFVIAHRGCTANAPENSIKAITDCIELGVDMVELDVRKTADGVLILMHDDTLERTTNGQGKVSDYSYDELTQLALKTKFGGENAPITGERIPTFEQAMLVAKDKILVNLDAKADVFNDAFNVLKRTDTQDHILMKKWLKPSDTALSLQTPFNQVLSMPVLAHPKAYQSKNYFSAIDYRAQLETHPIAAEFIFDSLDFAYQISQLARQNGVRSWLNSLTGWTSAGLGDAQALKNPDAVWGMFLAMGFSMIQTDHPKQLLNYLKKMKCEHLPNCKRHLTSMQFDR